MRSRWETASTPRDPSAVIDRGELAAWLRLLLTRPVGPVAVRKLLAALGSPQAVFAAHRAALQELLGERDAQHLSQEPEDLAAQIDATWAWLNAQPQRAVVTLADADYPRALLNTADPPILLFAQGRLSHLNTPSLAVVGSRNPTQQGRDNARAFAAAFSRAGLTVVSGLALGIDGAAHEGALQGAGGTVAVIGTGLDIVYPARHKALAQSIVEQGVIVTEFPLGTPPLPGHFPRRNRIIAGLSQGVLVVEAAVQSGSLHTARLGADMARDVFAIPGSIHSPQSRGCHALIKQGAKLVETAQDVLEELQFGGTPTSPQLPLAIEDDALASAEGGTDLLLDALGFDPVSLDALTARTGLPAADLNARLLDLELDGRVARLPGQLFQRMGLA